MSKLLAKILPELAVLISPGKDRGAYRTPGDPQGRWTLIVFLRGDMIELGQTDDIEDAKEFVFRYGEPSGVDSIRLWL